MKIIKFETASCQPCKMVDMMLRSYGLEVDERVDIEFDEVIREKYMVMKSPTILLVDEEGKELGRALGIDEEGILNLFRKAGKL